MTDIAERLRLPVDPDHPNLWTVDKDRLGAAVEIERLRAALQKIADLVDTDAGEPLDDAIEIANRALADPVGFGIPAVQTTQRYSP